MSVMSYRTLENEEELKKLWDLDYVSYGEYSGLPWDNFLSWWKAFPSGLHCAFSDNEIIGAVGMWPLHSSVYNSFIRGEMLETDITASDFDLTSDMKRHWYISGIVLRESWRRTGPIGALIFTAIENLGSLANIDRIDACAIASTKEGYRILNRFGFEPLGTQTSQGHPIFVSNDIILDLALGEQSIPVSDPKFKYISPLRSEFGTSELVDLDDLRVSNI